MAEKENRINYRKEFYEAEYAALVKNKTGFKYMYWKNRDKLRYYNELLNELNAESRKIDYPKLSDKAFLFLSIIGSFYITFIDPNNWIYRFLSVVTCLHILYFLGRETYMLGTLGHSSIRISEMHLDLDVLLTESREDVWKYKELRKRLFSLNNRQNIWMLLIILIDMLLSLVIIALSVYLLSVRLTHFFHDALNYILFSILALMYSCFHLTICIENLAWVRKVKLRLV